MDTAAYLKLQNGSDVRGVALPGVADEPVDLTPEIVKNIGYAFANSIAEKKRTEPSLLKIAVGRDSRLSGEMLAKALIHGITQAGASVLDCALSSTPAMFMSIVYPETACDASVMVTASHLPFHRNGLKFFTAEGGFEKEDIYNLLLRASQVDITDRSLPDDKVSSFDLLSLYAAKLCTLIKEKVKAASYDKPLQGSHFVIDAGNGSGGFFATKILEELGADTSGSCFLEPDGHFPNHVPNPENAEAMKSICRAVTENHADFGFIFDTDVDRMSAVFADGTPINRDSIIAFMAAILAPDFPGSTIVTDSVTSDRLTDFLEKDLHLKHLRFKRGYKNVINKCRSLNASGIPCPLAMETSGHGCLRDNYYLDDGAFLAVTILIALAKQKASHQKPEHLIAGLSQTYAAKEVRFRIEEEDFHAYGDRVLADFKLQARSKNFDLPTSYEGVRIHFPKGSLSAHFKRGWMLLRASLHDPVMVLNMEGETEDDLLQITKMAKGLLSFATRLDQSGLS
ncbi:MAG: phosphomannomutase/phosphoglucomutase [Lachnospiraceae bacterium]|nr:phosphomannomutase/phosphoglucomutase [Lachnospiraceae bacterium]MBF1012321.1 phosphomannomutase/phosphoglucomutase [Lachnospiraceae bacterium]